MEEIGISEILRNFHFIRPAWLLAIIPLIFVLILLRFQNIRVSAWEEIIDPSLLSYLLEKTDLRRAKSSCLPVFFLGSCCCCARRTSMAEDSPTGSRKR